MLLGATSCTQDFEDINTNPNQQIIGSNSGLLLGAQLSSSSELVDNVRGYNKGLAKWVQYYTTSLSANEFIPVNPRGDYNDFWIYQNLIVQSLPAVERVLDNTANGDQPNYRGAALVMKAWIYENITELWGPVPFSDAQFGEKSEEERYNKPKLDTQEEIMKGALIILEEANDTFVLSGNQSIAIEAASDAFAGGNILKWKKFANSLRLRILLRLSDVDPAFAQSGIEAIYNDLDSNPIMESNNDNFGVNYESPTGSFPDPLARYSLDNGFAPIASSGFVNILGERKDPRMKVLLAPAVGYKSTETYVGVPPAFDPLNPSGFTRIARDSVSSLSSMFVSVNSRNIMNFAEVKFIGAEASLKGYKVGFSSKSAYDDGIKAHMEEIGNIDEEQINNFMKQDIIVFKSDTGFEQIITQRYIAQFGQTVNTFSMIRRTGLPKLDYFKIGANADLGYPVRMQYPETFANFNKENFDAALQGVDIIGAVFGDKLWFAQNAPDVKMTDNLQTGPTLFIY
tara:strand:+ start:9956 stop:11491 length:1536 start_codon:yes stop_codon:yes gene_type:complete